MKATQGIRFVIVLPSDVVGLNADLKAMCLEEEGGSETRQMME
jgi:hypothetical protein